MVMEEIASETSIMFNYHDVKRTQWESNNNHHERKPSYIYRVNADYEEEELSKCTRDRREMENFNRSLLLLNLYKSFAARYKI